MICIITLIDVKRKPLHAFVRVLMDIVVKKINTAKRDQILDEFVSISHNINTQGNGVNSTILPPAIDTRVSLTLV